MNILCPNCQKMLSIADQYAGQLMKCPLCTDNFTAPLLSAQMGVGAGAAKFASASSSGETTASGPPATGTEDIFKFAGAPAPNAAVPPVANDTGAGKAASSDAASPPSPEIVAGPALPVGYLHTRTIWISPRVVPWIAPAALLLVFILSLFTWVRFYDGKGVPQAPSAWGLAFGENSNLFLSFYLLFFLASFAVATAAVVLPRLELDLPPTVQQFMPYRSGIVAGLVSLAFFFLVLQVVTGLNQESLSNGLLVRTNWFRFAATFHLVAMVTATLDFWLFLRKSRPLPRIDISW